MNDIIIVSQEIMKIYREAKKARLKGTSHSLFLLYNAAWMAGYTVNGINP